MAGLTSQKCLILKNANVLYWLVTAARHHFHLEVPVVEMNMP